MAAVQQLHLFVEEANHQTAERESLSDPLLDLFRSHRLSAGANAHTVNREVDQLTSLGRVATRRGSPCDLRTLLDNLDLVASLFMEPVEHISSTTWKSRLVAFQRLMRFALPTFGQDPEAAITHLDSFLPTLPTKRWDVTGTALPGRPERQQTLGPTLSDGDRHARGATVWHRAGKRGCCTSPYELLSGFKRRLGRCEPL